MARTWMAIWDPATILPVWPGAGAAVNARWNSVNGLMTFIGGGVAGDNISGTLTIHFPSDPFIYLDGSLTATANADLIAAGFVPADAFDLIAGLTNANPSGVDTCSIVFPVGTAVPPTNPTTSLYPRTGMTQAALFTLAGAAIVATATAHCAFNGQNTAQGISGNWGVQGTYRLVSSLLPPMPIRTPIMQGGRAQGGRRG